MTEQLSKGALFVAMFLLPGDCEAKELFSIRDKEAPLWRVQFSPDGCYLAVVNERSVVRVIDTKKWKVALVLRLVDGPTVDSIAFSSDSKTLIAGRVTLRQWSLPAGRLVKDFPGLPRGAVTSISVAKSRCCKSLMDGTILICDLKTQKATKVLKGHKRPSYETAFATNSCLLATCGWDPAVKVWNLKTGAELYTFHGHKYWILCVAWSPDEKELATASRDGVRLLDLEANAVKRTLTSSNALGSTSVAFWSDGSKIVAGDKAGSLVVWNPHTGKELGWLRPHKNSVWGITISPDGKMLATVGDDHTLRVWHAGDFCKQAALNLEKTRPGRNLYFP